MGSEQVLLMFLLSWLTYLAEYTWDIVGYKPCIFLHSQARDVFSQLKWLHHSPSNNTPRGYQCAPSLLLGVGWGQLSRPSRHYFWIDPIFYFMRSCGKVGMSDIWGGCILSSTLGNTNPQEVQSQSASLDSCGCSCSQTSPTCAPSRHLLRRCCVLRWAVCPCTASREPAVDGVLGASNFQHFPSPPRELWYLILFSLKWSIEPKP